MLMKRIGTLLLLLGMSTLSSAQVDASETLLMRAHMLRLKPLPDAEYPSEPGKVSLSAPVSVLLSPPEFLIGKSRPVPEVVLKMGGHPSPRQGGRCLCAGARIGTRRVQGAGLELCIERCMHRG